MADEFAFELQPRPFFIDHAIGNADVDDRAFLVDAVVVNDFELRFREGRRDLVLHQFHLHAIADGGAGGVLERFLAANVEADAGVKFQRLATRGGFGIAKHHADFFAQLVGENAGGLGLVENGREFAEGLAHQAGLHAHRRHAHLAFEFGLRHECGDGIDDDHVERIGPGERFANRKRFFAAVRLGNEEFIQVDAQFAGVSRI